MSILDQFNNDPLKDGYIFILVAGNHKLPPAYISSRHGHWGYFARLNAESENGFDPITFQEYENA